MLCPLCGCSVVYQGMVNLECVGPACANRVKNLPQQVPTTAGFWESVAIGQIVRWRNERTFKLLSVDSKAGNVKLRAIAPVPGRPFDLSKEYDRGHWRCV